MTRILHLSDTHVSATGRDGDGVDAIAALERMLYDLRHVPDLDLVVVSGDIADDGSAAGCAAVRARIGEFAARRRIPHIYSTGNHDDRTGFRDALGSGHIGADGTDIGKLIDNAGDLRAAVTPVGGLRVITLDSLVPGETHGVVDERQLRWLSGLLSSPTEVGTVLVFHHPPLRFPAIPNVKRVVLQNIDELEDVVSGTDVRAILTGHLHFQASGFLGGVPLWVTPGVVTRIDTTAERHLVRGVLGAGATVVDVTEPTAPTFHLLHARDPRAGEEVYVYDALTGADVAESEPAPSQAATASHRGLHGSPAAHSRGGYR
ncbi:metallophosphoesterase [Kribbella capetownensis]|uniref:Metallophosphoesterase n=1 Tax=Kribbella capetownensis TaxID=1572659 RepID=A0A4R0IVP9_9ACTN|nr:metallophosphoesterase [Kribbella capetownensis]TCC37399.1 metallophosphoesterase [Kribbella capetownensis]